ncbi:MAG TPA: DNA ligase D [Vicinamibacterales bacterium]|nr:DNA ligase D [Vicinamibacterales bacterium]
MAAPAIARPMLASLADASLVDSDLVYEPKYDGIRAIAEIAPRGGGVHLWSRLGNEKTNQFPEIVGALRSWAKHLKEPIVLDGEVVALDANGQPAGFQNLQGRIHLKSGEDGVNSAKTAFIAFDVLRAGTTDFRAQPLVERRKGLEHIFSDTGSPLLRISEIAYGDGRALHKRAVDNGWEGLIAKVRSSRYVSGKRSPDWRKLKLLQEQEFVVAGWSEPRKSRTHFGALILGVYDGDELRYVGHVGTGFDSKELDRVMALLRPLETKTSPFRQRVPKNETPHWVKPKLVAQVRFTEWTSDGILRQPVYLGLRDDKKAKQVTRETPNGSTGSLIEQLNFLEDAKKDAFITLPDGAELKVTNLHKTFWPKLKLTKGDLIRYYVQIAPYILPVVADRPLVMKRFPNGVEGEPFYQHRAMDVPRGIRTADIEHSDGNKAQLVGGDLLTLLYMAQIAAISQDPWFSRVQSLDQADYAAIDLDPAPGVTFTEILDVARWVHDELESIGAPGFPKTSGAEGLHIYIPLPPGTPYEAGMIFCQIIATVVAQKHPKIATVERMVKKRGRQVYVDYLQNIPGKTLATAYSARASAYAGVSTPLTWKEVHDGIEREAFTIHTVPERLKKVGDLWSALRKSKGVNLERVARYVQKK